MKCRILSILNASYAIIFLSIFIFTANVYSQAAVRYRVRNKPIIEVLTSGKGLILESEKELLFIRLYKNGVLEFDRQTRTNTIRKNIKVKIKNIKNIFEILETGEFESSKKFYDSLESLKDAVQIVRININYKNKVKSIVIKNYMPEHPEATRFYPSYLVNLLSKLQQIRPLSKYEKENNLILDLPYY